jgi:sugar diacid utilization regulator
VFPNVGEVLALDIVRRGRPRVVAGEHSLAAPVRWVRWLRPSEPPAIAHQVRGGELVLTTGLALPNDATGLARFINELADAGASGLVVELGQRWADAVPAELRAAAEHRGLPLVELHQKTAFVAVTEAVHRHIVDALVDREREGLARQAHRTLLAGILSHATAPADVAQRARALGVPLDARRLVGVVVRLRGAVGQSALQAQARLRDLADAAAAAAREAGLAALVGALDEDGGEDGVGLLVALPGHEQAEPALDALSAALARHRGDLPAPVVAAGSVVSGLQDARRSLLEAKQVATAALHLPEQRRWYCLPEVHLRGLVHLLRDDARLQTYVERELGRLLDHDNHSTLALEPVLRAYLEHGRNKSAAAGAAHLSRPAFYERLHKVERVLEVDLDAVEICLSLHVALVALDALRSEGRS